MKKLYALTIAALIGTCAFAIAPAHADYRGDWTQIKSTKNWAQWVTCDWRRPIRYDNGRFKKYEYRTTRAMFACPAP